MLSIFESIGGRRHKEVFPCQDKDTALRVIIAIHNSTIVLAIIGCRMWNYNTYEHALRNVQGLSKGMIFKTAIPGLNLVSKLKNVYLPKKKVIGKRDNA